MMKLKNLGSKKPEFGISIYPTKATKQELLDYMKLAKEHGFKRVFTNLIGLSASELKQFKEISIKGSEMGMHMIADIDETVLKEFDIKLSDMKFFKQIGIKVIRMDVKFNAEEVAKLSKNKEGVELEINASDFSGIEKEIIEFDYNPDKIVASHNFFPQKLTGLNYQKFHKANSLMKKAKLRISAFVAKQGDKTVEAWDESEGAVTMEVLRNMNIVDQFQYLMAMRDIDIILVSNMYLTKQEFKEISELSINKITFKGKTQAGLTKNEEEIFKYHSHKLRGDNADSLFFRSTISRKVFINKDIPPKNKSIKFFNPGDVVVLNNEYGRYKGELHIIKNTIPACDKKNLIGKIDEKQLPLLDLSRPLLLFNIKNEEG